MGKDNFLRNAREILLHCGTEIVRVVVRKAMGQEMFRALLVLLGLQHDCRVWVSSGEREFSTPVSPQEGWPWSGTQEGGPPDLNGAPVLTSTDRLT